MLRIEGQSQMVMVALLAAIMAVGCATHPPQTSQANEAESAVPFLQSKLTVDEVVAEFRAGKSIAEIRPKLGVPIASVWRANFFLVDGCVTETRDSFRILRFGDEKDFVFKKPKVVNQ